MATLSTDNPPLHKQDTSSGIILMLLIFVLAGAFSQVARSMGCVDSMVNITLSILPPGMVMTGLFLAACAVSLSIGTSCGTIAALTPIAAGIATATGTSTPMLIAVVVGGSLFGDNLSFISDTTIMSTKTQGCLMKDKFWANIRIALPAALLTMLIYLFLGWQVTKGTEYSDFSLLHTLPYLVVLVLAVMGVGVVWVLAVGLLLASCMALLEQSMTATQLLEAAQVGVMGMHDLIIITIVAAAAMDYLRRRGVIEWLIGRMGKVISTRRGAELSIAVAVTIADMLTATNPIAILAVGPVARSISYSYGIPPQRAASILDTMSCFAQGLLPWGAQLLIAAGLAQISPLEIIPYLFYPYILGAFTLRYIFLSNKKKNRQHGHHQQICSRTLRTATATVRCP